MKKEIIINGKSYVPAELTFNAICKFEDMGVLLEEAGNKTINTLRAYFALCMGTENVVLAGEELENHVINGGNFNDLGNAMNNAIEESGFFQAMAKSK